MSIENKKYFEKTWQKSNLKIQWLGGGDQFGEKDGGNSQRA